MMPSGEAGMMPSGCRSLTLAAAIAVLLLLEAWLVASAQSSIPIPSIDQLDGTPLPPELRSCAVCHSEQVKAYLRHGMAGSVGSASDMPSAQLHNPVTGSSHRSFASDNKHYIETLDANGGGRMQQIVGHIGAGIKARSWVGAEYDPLADQLSGRLFFVPLESISRNDGQQHLSLAPFARHDRNQAFGLPLTAECLNCHSDTRLSALPAAATAGSDDIYPANHLGHAAMSEILPLGCAACHGDIGSHAERIVGNNQNSEPASSIADIGLLRLADLPPVRQLDVCGRCHLQGEVRLDLVSGRVDLTQPLAVQIPVLVATQTGEDFGFVSQLERLTLSACLQESDAMTCSSCHQPHQGVNEQGLHSFERACVQCHAAQQSPHSPQTVAQITGHAARGELGCVDCHMRRSQPSDLPSVTAVDHHIRKRIASAASGPSVQPPAADITLRLFASDKEQTALQSAAGQQWYTAVLGMAELAMGRPQQANVLFGQLPAPGSAAARAATAPAGFTPLQSNADFHLLRGMALLAAADFASAERAFNDALSIAPGHAAARMQRATVNLQSGDLAAALRDSEILIQQYPLAEQPWDLRVLVAERASRADLAISALQQSLERWPSNGRNWWKLGLLLQQQGDAEGHHQAMRQVRRLAPALLPAGTD